MTLPPPGEPGRTYRQASRRSTGLGLNKEGGGQCARGTPSVPHLDARIERAPSGHTTINCHIGAIVHRPHAFDMTFSEACSRV